MTGTLMRKSDKRSTIEGTGLRRNFNMLKKDTAGKIFRKQLEMWDQRTTTVRNATWRPFALRCKWKQ